MQEKEKKLNKYERVILTAMRARELAEGINVTPEMEGRKITSIAIEEMSSGKLKFSEDRGGEDGQD